MSTTKIRNRMGRGTMQLPADEGPQPEPSRRPRRTVQTWSERFAELTDKQRRGHEAARAAREERRELAKQDRREAARATAAKTKSAEAKHETKSAEAKHEAKGAEAKHETKKG